MSEETGKKTKLKGELKRGKKENCLLDKIREKCETYIRIYRYGN